MIRRFKNSITDNFRHFLLSHFPNIDLLGNVLHNSYVDQNVKIYSQYKIVDCTIGDYTYIAEYSTINRTKIGRFCSIGPKFTCGWGIHPTNFISTSPMFYSTRKQNGVTMSPIDKVQETKNIVIGNDVFIGMNVTVLDGITIGDGAVIGAGSVVSKDIPAYAIAVGAPIQIKKFRFSEEQIKALQKIRWWDWNEDKLQEVEKYIDNVEAFIERYNGN